jgi:hypothetical protein
MTWTVTLEDGELFLPERKMKGKTLSKAEAARWLGMSPQNLNNWIRRGKITQTPDGEMPLEEVVRHLKD